MSRRRLSRKSCAAGRRLMACEFLTRGSLRATLWIATTPESAQLPWRARQYGSQSSRFNSLPSLFPRGCCAKRGNDRADQQAVTGRLVATSALVANSDGPSSRDELPPARWDTPIIQERLISTTPLWVKTDHMWDSCRSHLPHSMPQALFRPSVLCRARARPWNGDRCPRSLRSTHVPADPRWS